MSKILFERRGPVAVVTLNSHERRNALSSEVRQGLRDAFDQFERDPSLACAVLAARGSTFCAGYDLKEMAERPTDLVPAQLDLPLGGAGSPSKPVVAAVNGPALGGGFALVQGCDLVVASSEASFAISEVHRGRGAPWSAPLIAMLGQRHMMQLLLTGDPISAQRAYEIGLVNEVVAPEDLLPRAIAVAERIAQAAPLSVRAAKELVLAAAEFGLEKARSMAGEIYEPVYLSHDAREGPRAFAERRDPVWTGT